jgi:hypothetical protein
MADLRPVSIKLAARETGALMPITADEGWPQQAKVVDGRPSPALTWGKSSPRSLYISAHGASVRHGGLTWSASQFFRHLV